jgi:hypothetical protein
MHWTKFWWLIVPAFCFALGCDEDSTGSNGDNNNQPGDTSEDEDTGTGEPEDTGTGPCEPAFTPIEFTFDDGFQGFGVAEDDTSADVPVFEHNPDEGALELQGDFLAEQQTHIQIEMNDADWTCASEITFMIRILEAPFNGGLQPFVMSGDWWWLDRWNDLVIREASSPLVLPLPLEETDNYRPTEIKRVGLRVSIGEDAPVHIIIDSVTVQ